MFIATADKNGSLNPPLRVYTNKKPNWAVFCESCYYLLNERNPQCIDELLNIIKEAADISFPKLKPRLKAEFNIHWWDAEIESAIKYRRMCFNRFSRSHSWENLLAYKRAAKAKYLIRSVKRSSFRNFCENQLTILEMLGKPSKNALDNLPLIVHGRLLYLTYGGKEHLGAGEGSWGLPQRSVLSPDLFNLYELILGNILTAGAELIQFADDLLIFLMRCNMEKIVRILQENIRRICEWLNERNLFISPTKSAAMILAKPKIPPERPVIRLEDDIIP
ncbi:hypothetical protein HHI36_001377 [Cryptolaemus montrouzieri]|uniref:Reverse transcriptase domain-containing protein n=1 Tax=Cryptolaemus montrouzieri TaxID=559131 RepID=A0ABD2P7L6_9CUCU